jgi:hypothetical protein
MRLGHMAVGAIVLAVLAGCNSPSYRNVAHPNYGDAEFKNDQADCRSQASKIVTRTGYDTATDVQVDEDKARACLADRGWQPVGR